MAPTSLRSLIRSTHTRVDAQVSKRHWPARHAAASMSSGRQPGNLHRPQPGAVGPGRGCGVDSINGFGGLVEKMPGTRRDTPGRRQARPGMIDRSVAQLSPDPDAHSLATKSVSIRRRQHRLDLKQQIAQQKRLLDEAVNLRPWIKGRAFVGRCFRNQYGPEWHMGDAHPPHQGGP